MKSIFFVVVFIVITFTSFAQTTMQDVVYLKNGSIIRGTIIEQVPNKSIKLQTIDGNIFVYAIDEIEKMTKEQHRTNSTNTNQEGELVAGYAGRVELGYALGVGDFGLDNIKLNIINGYRLNNYLNLGLGLGARYYPDAEALLVPVFIDARSNFLAGKFSPYLGLSVGYSFDATADFEGVGLLINPQIGISIVNSAHSDIDIGIGYDIQRARFFYSDGYGIYRDAISVKALSFNLGISF